MRAEAFGVPQRRHRVIIVGIRSDLAGRAADAEITVSGMARTVRDVLETMPTLRSGISRGLDDAVAWRGEVLEAANMLAGISKGEDNRALREAFLSVSEQVEENPPTVRAASRLPDGYGTSNDEL